jgi:hypothetical protein
MNYGQKSFVGKVLLTAGLALSFVLSRITTAQAGGYCQVTNYGPPGSSPGCFSTGCQTNWSYSCCVGPINNQCVCTGVTSQQCPWPGS